MKNLKFKQSLFIALLVLFLGFAFVGCDNNTDNGGSSQGDNGGGTADDGGNTGDVEEDQGYTVSFIVDEHTTVTVYATQEDMTSGANGEVSTTAKSKDGDTGVITSNDGQVNFVLSFSEGYEIDTISVDGSYNKVKGSGDTLVENGYRITKVASDLTVTITTKEKDAEEDYSQGYLVTFVSGEHYTVTVYNTQDMSNGGSVSNTAYSRDSATGALTLTDGQVNFSVNVDEGYVVDAITIEGGYRNLKEVTDSGVANSYRITKITSELTVTITLKEAETEEGEGTTPDEVSDTVISSNYNENLLELNVALANGTFSYSYENDVLVLSPNSSLSSVLFTLDGFFNGCIQFNLTDSQELELFLNGLTLYSSGTLPPIYIASGDNASISAKKETVNFIYDNREYQDNLGSAIYSVCDLMLKGTGSLTINSTNNKGIHTKDDLEVKNLTLNVNVVDNCLKGNDSVTIIGGKLTLISRQGDGIKTSNSEKKYNSDGSLKKVQGTISLVGGEIEIYSACDGIDASYNVEIGSGVVLTIYTDKYSNYSEEVTQVSESTMYIRSNTTSYKYSMYFYNSSEEYVWVNSSSYKQVSGGRNTYYYYEISKPSGYSNFILYVYSSSQSQGQSSNYVATSGQATLNDSYDTIAYNVQRNSFSWTNYTTQSGGGMGPGGPGQEGNPDKGDYSTKGIKASNEIIITGGTIFIKSYDDAIHANNDEILGDEDDATDDYYGLGNITISGGNITLYSNDDGIHADQDLYIKGDAVITVTYSYEGCEANRIYVSGAKTIVYAKNDAMNAAECNGKYTPCVEVSGGLLDLSVGSGDTDTLDSNGNVNISGGIVILKNAQTNGSSMTGGTIDLDGKLTINGGAVISIGCWCNEANMSSQASSTSTTLSSGNYNVKDNSGNVVCEFELTQSYKGYKIYFYGKNGTYTLNRDGSKVLSF